MIPLPDYPDVVVPYQEVLTMERNRIKEFPKVVGNQVIHLDVHQLLNGVDLKRTYRLLPFNRERLSSINKERLALRSKLT
jgi:hypothetical protein